MTVIEFNLGCPEQGWPPFVQWVESQGLDPTDASTATANWWSTAVSS